MNPAAVALLLAAAEKLGPPLIELLAEAMQAMSRRLAASGSFDVAASARNIVEGIESAHGERLSGSEKRLLAQRAIAHRIRGEGGVPDTRAINALIEMVALPWGVAEESRP